MILALSCIIIYTAR